MKEIELPGGGTAIFTGPDDEADAHKKVIDARWEVAMKICEEKGWEKDLKELSIDRILEIRQDPRWKNAGR